MTSFSIFKVKILLCNNIQYKNTLSTADLDVCGHSFQFLNVTFTNPMQVISKGHSAGLHHLNTATLCILMAVKILFLQVIRDL